MPSSAIEHSQLVPLVTQRARWCVLRRFAFQGIERRAYDQALSPALVLANAVHQALERFVGLPPSDRAEATLHQALRSVWREHAKPGLFGSREEEAECGRSALAMLSRFAAPRHHHQARRARASGYRAA